MKRLFSALLCAVLLFSLCSCSVTPPAVTGTVTVTDMVGRQVSVNPGSYKRIVCIGAGALRMYTYVGDVSLLCAVEDIENETLTQRPQMFDSVARPYVLAYGDVFAKLPSCGVGGPQAQAADAEKLLSCKPDLIISEYEDADKSNALQEQLGVPVITLQTGPDGVFDPAFTGSLELLGKVLGKEDRAKELVDYVAQEMAAIQAATANVTHKPSVYICGLGNWGTTNHLMTAGQFAPLQVANVNNVLSGTETMGVHAIEKETFVALGKDMDIIIMDAAAVKNIKPLYAEDPTMFNTCKAWTDGKVYLQMAYNVYYTNFELALANTWFIAKSVYPEQLQDMDMTAKLNEITKMFLGEELADEIFACPGSFGGYQQINTGTFFG